MLSFLKKYTLSSNPIYCDYIISSMGLKCNLSNKKFVFFSRAVRAGTRAQKAVANYGALKPENTGNDGVFRQR